MELLKVGTEIFNHGDMANSRHFGVITEVEVSKYSTQYKIKETGDTEEPREYWVMAMGFSNEYKGNGSTRLVTKKAYDDYKKSLR